MQNRSAAATYLTTAEPTPIFLAQILAALPVWGYDGEPLGHGRALALDQVSGQPLCLLVGRGQALRSLRPVPWASLRYDGRLRAYLADVTAPLFLLGPVWPRSVGRARPCVERAHIYYDVYYERQAQV